jgi:predicted enzyme related to lactoylglutathione lyase
MLGRMTIHIHNVTFDCADARALAGFWSELTGWNVYYDDDPEVLLAPTFPNHGTGFLFIPVPEGKTAKNRVHLDIQPTDGTRDALVETAVAHGATVVGDFRKEDGSGWVTLADPEGNEFCVERGAGERGPSRPRTIRLDL